MFDHEKLEVYKVQLQFLGWLTVFMDELDEKAKRKAREPFDHLDRASLSTLLNTAEGNGKRQRKIRAKFFDDARGSATECAACLDALVAKNVYDARRIEDGKVLLHRVVSMLTKLVQRFDDDEIPPTLKGR